MCCDHRRSEWQTSHVPVRNVQKSTPADLGKKVAVHPAMPDSLPGNLQTTIRFHTIRYVDASPVRVRGLITGSSYEFTTLQPIQVVDARDAASLLNIRYFRRVEIEQEHL